MAVAAASRPGTSSTSCATAGYVPIDVSGEHLHRSARALGEEYPDIEVLPLCADFTRSLDLPACRKAAARRVVYFPGSTLGNFTPEAALAFLRQTAGLCGRGGALLLGIDLRKDPRVIEAAYNDRRGVTAAFNRNLLVRINRELGADFDIEQFAHRAFYNAAQGANRNAPRQPPRPGRSCWRHAVLLRRGRVDPHRELP